MDKNSVKISSCTTSRCGNFVFLGYEDGGLVKINLQSGILREMTKESEHHDGPVTGIKTDAMNRMLISTGMDGEVRIWDFFKLGLMHKIIPCKKDGDNKFVTLNEAYSSLYNLTLDSVNLFAFTTSALSLCVYDALTLK
jgi:WD40 repeat protein